jgi:hypothetical protein
MDTVREARRGAAGGVTVAAAEANTNFLSAPQDSSGALALSAGSEFFSDAAEPLLLRHPSCFLARELLD